ncbi:MAG: hypothetical protein WDW36_007314 [Sanguina aurantia]
MHAFVCPAARVAQLATAVRIGHVVLLLVLDASLPDYDTSTDLLQAPAMPLPCTRWGAHTRCETTVQAAPNSSDLHGDNSPLRRDSSIVVGAGQRFWRLMVWDSIYYVDIARYGWKFEHYYAFFPLLPAIMGLSPSHLLPLAAVGLSVAASVTSAVLLYWLTGEVLGSERHAATASLVYILGPASLFHAVAYTEALFTALTLAGLCMLYCRRSLVGAAVCFHLACWTRSNVVGCPMMGPKVGVAEG